MAISIKVRSRRGFPDGHVVPEDRLRGRIVHQLNTDLSGAVGKISKADLLPKIKRSQLVPRLGNDFDKVATVGVLGRQFRARSGIPRDYPGRYAVSLTRGDGDVLE